MKQKSTSISPLNPLSIHILNCGIRLTLLMLFISRLYIFLCRNAVRLNTVLFTCARCYPLLTLMVLSISVSGALLIDIYDKTQK